MELKKRIAAFSSLSEFLINYKYPEDEALSDFDKAIEKAAYHNPWFSIDNILFSVKSLGESIRKNQIENWLTNYSSTMFEIRAPKNVAVIMAGNLPLVGFHDFFYVLMSGNCIISKLSSDDTFLLPAIANKIIEFEPEFLNFISFSENKLKNFDAVIATGSNNSARYFEYYFGKYPNIIRKSRNAIAVLTNEMTNEDYFNLSNDILRYYGLGCRNVSKLFVPEDFDLNHLLASLYENANLVNNSKYQNNYDYYKSIYLINKQAFYDNGCIILKEEKLISSPISVVYFEFYKDIETIKEFIFENEEKIQCIVSNSQTIKNTIPFGKAQHPSLTDYADGVDVMDFLIKLN